MKLELALRIKHAKIIALYDKAVLDFAQHPCCSCNRLFQKKAGTVVRFSDKIGTMWGMLKQHILKEDPQAILQFGLTSGVKGHALTLTPGQRSRFNPTFNIRFYTYTELEGKGSV